MKKTASPVTGSPSDSLLELDTEIIKRRYIEELSLPVDKYFSGIDKVTVYCCPDTGYLFYYPFNIFADADFYKLLNKTNKDYYTPWKWENEEAFKFIKPTDFVLDVGCGEGLFLKELKKKGIQNLYGIDVATDTGSTDGIKLENATIEKFSGTNKEKFDVVTCFQVMEHIVDVKSFISGCLSCLKQNGVLVVAVPNSHPYIYKYDLYHTLNLPPHHSGLWNKNSLKKLCNYFPVELLYTGFQPIGPEINHYSDVQIDHYASNSAILKYLFSIGLFRRVYKISLSLFKKWIKGHSIIVVYRKK